MGIMVGQGMNMGKDVEIAFTVTYTLSTDLGIMAEKMGISERRLQRQIEDGSYETEDILTFISLQTEPADWTEIETTVADIVMS